MSNLGGIVDVAIGMSFIYLLLSLVCSGINELIAWLAGLRASTLRSGIETLLKDPALAGIDEKLYQHPLIEALAQKTGLGGKPAPSYIPSSTFVLALLDTLGQQGGEHAKYSPESLKDVEGIKKLLANLPAKSAVRRQLTLMIDETVKDVAMFRLRVEGWFDNSMDRLSGVYKRRSQLIGIAVGLVVAFSTGVDSLIVSNALMHDGALRQATVAAAVEYSKKPLANGAEPDLSAATDRVAKAMDKLDELKLPIGLAYLKKAHDVETEHPTQFVIWRLLGMLFTGVALSFGAPFWFDMLNKLVNVRTNGPAPEKSDKSAPAAPQSEA